MKVQGFFWFRNAEEYEWLRSISEDRSSLPDSYSGWLEAAESGYQQIERNNTQIELIKVEVEPEINADISGRGFGRSPRVRLGGRPERLDLVALRPQTHYQQIK